MQNSKELIQQIKSSLIKKHAKSEDTPVFATNIVFVECVNIGLILLIAHGITRHSKQPQLKTL